jgi:hypothetical protein
MVLNITREPTSCAATRHFPTNLWTLKVHNHIHNSSPLVPILRHTNLAHSTQSYLCKNHLNVIYPPKSRPS